MSAEDVPKAEERTAPKFVAVKMERKPQPDNMLTRTHAKSFPRTDADRAQRFAEWAEGKIHYIPEEERWVFWNGKNWQRDSGGEVIQRIIEFTDELRGEIDEIQNLKAQAAAYKTLEAARSRRAIEAVKALAATHALIRANITEWDKDPWLIGVTNGVVDLRTGIFREATPEDRVLKKLGCPYAKGAISQRWKNFIATILPQDGVAPFVQRSLGYSLTGDTSEQVLFFLYGQGQNGKSTLIEMMQKIMGNYTWRANSSLFLEQRVEGEEDVKIGPLLETRFVTGSEVKENSRLAEARIKDLTGGDTLHGRMRYGHPFQFTATHKLWLYGNHKPRIAGTDNGIWRRMRLIPFEVAIPEEKRIRNIKDLLWEEASGILNWLIGGCLEWQKGGLCAPDAVMAAGADYRDEEDTIGEFILSQCEKDPKAVSSRREIYRAYKLWCEAAGQYALGPRTVADRLAREPGVPKSDKQVKINGIAERCWFGIKLIDPGSFR